MIRRITSKLLDLLHTDPPDPFIDEPFRPGEEGELSVGKEVGRSLIRAWARWKGGVAVFDAPTPSKSNPNHAHEKFRVYRADGLPTPDFPDGLRIAFGSFWYPGFGYAIHTEINEREVGNARFRFSINTPRGGFQFYTGCPQRIFEVLGMDHDAIQKRRRRVGAMPGDGAHLGDSRLTILHRDRVDAHCFKIAPHEHYRQFIIVNN